MSDAYSNVNILSFYSFFSLFSSRFVSPVFDRLGTPPVPVKALKGDFYNLKAGTPITIGTILFTKIETESAPKVEVKIVAKAKKAEVVKEDPSQVDFTKMDLRVGYITKVWNHEKADTLYCEEIDVGEEAPRPVASGLRQHYTIQEMMGRKVIVVCNLKEITLQGFASCGMVLAAKTEGDDAKMILLDPPAGSAVGDRVSIEGLLEGDMGGGKPSTNVKIAKKAWEAVKPGLKTDSAGVACWNDKPMLVGKEPITAVTAVNAPIS